jgi:hypothetical protein
MAAQHVLSLPVDEIAYLTASLAARGVLIPLRVIRNSPHPAGIRALLPLPVRAVCFDHPVSEGVPHGKDS